MRNRFWKLAAALAFALGASQASADVALSLDPASLEIVAGGNFNVDVVAQIPLDPVNGGLVGWGFTLEFDDSLMELTGVTGGPLWDLVFAPTTTTPLDPLVALLTPTPTSPPEGATGSDVLLAVLEFHCLRPGTSLIEIAVADPVTDPSQGFVTAFGTGDQIYAAWTATPATITQKVPEPAGLALVASAALAAFWVQRRRIGS